MLSQACSEAPLCLDGEEEVLSAAIMSIHDGLVAKRGFAPELSVERQEELASHILSVVSSVFCTIYAWIRSSAMPIILNKLSFSQFI